MATSVTQSLFGLTPDMYQQAQQRAMQEQAMQFARLSPAEKASMGFFSAGSQLGTGLAGLMGYQDPEMQRIKARQGLLGGIDMSDPAALRQAAQQAQQSGDFAAAQELITRAAEAEQTAEQTAASRLKKQQLQADIDRERALREEIAKLPENATEAQMLGVLRKFGDPDKVLQTMQQSETARMNREQRATELQMNLDARLQQAELNAQNRLQLAEMNNASREQIAALNRQNQAMIAEMRMQGQRELAALKSSLTQKGAPKDVAEADQDIVLLSAKATKADEYIKLLQDNPKLMDRIPRARGFVTSALGIESEEARKQAEINKYVKEQVNTILMAAKGVQTEGDAQRAAAQVLDFLETGTTEGYKQALNNMKRWQDTILRGKKTYIQRRGFSHTPEVAAEQSDEDLINKYSK